MKVFFQKWLTFKSIGFELSRCGLGLFQLVDTLRAKTEVFEEEGILLQTPFIETLLKFPVC